MSSIQVLIESPQPHTLSIKQYNMTEIPKPKDQNTGRTEAAKLA